MCRSRPPAGMGGYVLALALSATTVVAHLAAGFGIGDEPPVVLLVIPIILSAYVGGLGPGLASTAFIGLGSMYFILPPAYSFHIATLADYVRWVSLVVAGLLVCALSEALHRSRRRAEAALHQQVALQERVALITATAPGVILSFQQRPDGSVSFPFASSTIEGIYGLRPDQLAKDAAAAFALIHPDDIDRVRATIAESARTLSVWREDFRVLNPERGELRRRASPHLQVIAMSGGGRVKPEGYLEVARAFGAVRALSKPFESEELFAAIAAALG